MARRRAARGGARRALAAAAGVAAVAAACCGAAAGAALDAERVEALAAEAKPLWEEKAFLAFERDEAAGTITIVFVSKGAGWVSLGWHDGAITGEMFGADLFMAAVQSDGTLRIADMNSKNNAVPKLDDKCESCQSCGDNFLETYGKYDATSGFTTVAFVRAMAAPDAMDLDLGVRDEWTRLLAAYEHGDTGDFSVQHTRETRQDHLWANFYTGEVCGHDKYHECRPDRSPPGQDGTPLKETRDRPDWECPPAAAPPLPPPPVDEDSGSTAAPAPTGGEGGEGGESGASSEKGGEEGESGEGGGSAGAIGAVIAVIVLAGAAIGGYYAYKAQRRRRYLRMTRAFMLDGMGLDGDDNLDGVLGDAEPVGSLQSDEGKSAGGV